MIKLTYEELVCGGIINVDGVGHLRPVKLNELKSAHGVGFSIYDTYVGAISWNRETLKQYIYSTRRRRFEKLEDERLNTFDIATLLPETKLLLTQALNFFFNDKVEWDEKLTCFHVLNSEKEVGVIDRDNYLDVRDAILKMQYIGLDGKSNELKFASKAAKQAWERVQAYKRAGQAKTEQERRMELGNIISKLCAAGIGYTLLNIFDLTIFQLYDQFFQYGYLRATALSERSYSIYGGKKFKFEAWLDPITKL